MIGDQEAGARGGVGVSAASAPGPLSSLLQGHLPPPQAAFLPYTACAHILDTGRFLHPGFLGTYICLKNPCPGRYSASFHKEDLVQKALYMHVRLASSRQDREKKEREMQCQVAGVGHAM